ncbi:hypothetical protein Tco_1277122 [Tanacetum coccineum]
MYRLPDLMAKGLSARMIMEHKDAQGVSLFTSRALRRLFDIRGLLVHKFILDFFSTFRFGEAILDLNTPGALQLQLRGARRCLSWRQFIVALGLHTGEEMESPNFARYWAESADRSSTRGLRELLDGIIISVIFPWHSPSYTSIQDPILRLCHRLIACSIAGRSQAPEKVTVTDLFYLRGMDVGSINVPYLLARLQELTIIVLELPIIDMAELVRLQIYEEIKDTWAWVALGLERQPNATAGATEDAHVVDEGGQAVSAPVQAPQQPPPPPPTTGRTMTQRLGT